MALGSHGFLRLKSWSPGIPCPVLMTAAILPARSPHPFPHLVASPILFLFPTEVYAFTYALGRAGAGCSLYAVHSFPRPSLSLLSVSSHSSHALLFTSVILPPSTHSRLLPSFPTPFPSPSANCLLLVLVLPVSPCLCLSLSLSTPPTLLSSTP